MVRFSMFRSLLKFPTKHRGHEDAEKELVEVMDLFSEYPLHLSETDKTEFKDEHDRLQREIRLNVDIISDDCRALKGKVKKTIDDRRVAYVRREVSVPTGVGGLGGHQKLNPSPARVALETNSSHSDQPPDVKTIASLSTTLAGTLPTDKTRFKPQSGVPSVNPRSGLPQSHHIPTHANLKQAISQVTSGISSEVDSMVMVGTTAKCPTLNIDSPDCTGASTNFDQCFLTRLTTSTTEILSHGPQIAQQVPQPARPRRAVGRRAQQQPRNFMQGNYSSNSSMILCGSNVTGATLNINSTNSSGAVFHHDNHLKRVR
ncbi:hypothetical protein DFJ58DRAFT_802771 [Suillus subalutaceus]|uniref:uncharacterized protein n=1 Tax=Suillus subalutaceus TaxID=48586 RepID=UPI001B875A6D|nr:uncharacterized protein DFJ58DRAFT_802771 [Suillus subalutaceus]KAG1844317.1 hypothetical protein DFJ58DRAFT_802771 [Suillus subalutaceus]